MKYDVLIVGAGVVGGMVARELSKYRLSVCLLEKESDVACGASKANSGIIHGGYDPEPGTLKAEMNLKGVELLYQAAEELHVPYRKNGSLVCAFGEEENVQVQKLYDRGLENGIQGLQILSGEEARALEPNLSERLTLALLVPNAGIICPYQLTVAAIGNAMDNGVELMRNFAVSRVEKNDQGFLVYSQEGKSVSGKILINCAGCYSDRIAALAGDSFFSIIPRAGEYMLMDRNAGKTVSHTIFQVPSKEGKGILVSPTADGNLLVGPTAVRVDSPENKETTKEGLDTVVRVARKSVPNLDYSQVITSFSGIRSSEKDGDFIICKSSSVDGLIHAAAIDSPGLTSCVAIARCVVEICRTSGLNLEEKKNWDGNRPDPHAFSHLSDEEKNAWIQKNPSYGKIVCRCETVTEGEILDAIRTNPGATDVDGVKRRTRSGMGRCQGGFCSSYVMKLIARERKIPMEEVTKKGGNSRMVVERMK